MTDNVCSYCSSVAENDPAVVYSAVRPAEDLSYGQVVFKDKKTNRTRGTADLVCLRHEQTQV